MINFVQKVLSIGQVHIQFYSKQRQFMPSTVKSNCNQGHNPLCPVGWSAKMYKVTDNTIMDVDVFKVHSKCMFLNVLTRGIHVTSRCFSMWGEVDKIIGFPFEITWIWSKKLIQQRSLWLCYKSKLDIKTVKFVCCQGYNLLHHNCIYSFQFTNFFLLNWS